MQYKDKEYKVDSVIFDVDGTIWDSTGVVTEAWNKALIDTGFGHIQVTAERLKGLFGLPMIDIMMDILPGVEEKELREFERVCNEYEEEFILEKAGDVYENIGEVIAEISKDIPVYIVSNCQSGYIELVIKHLKLEEYVSDFTCFGDTGMFKAPNIRLICDKHKLEAPVYVGDTHMDADACKEADVPMIFVNYGFGKVDEPWAEVSSPNELLELIKKCKKSS